MKDPRESIIAIPALLLLSIASDVVSQTSISLEAAILHASSKTNSGFGYGLGLKKSLFEFKYAEIYSGVRATYIPAQIKSRFVINAPHNLFYFGIPAGITLIYKGNPVEPFFGFDTQLDFKAIDFKENKPDMFCNVDGECTDSGPSVQPEKYRRFIIRGSPKIGLGLNLGKAIYSVSSGIKFDLTTFSIRGTGESRASSILVEAGLTFQN